MSEMEDRVRQAFKDETLDILSGLEETLLQLEEDPEDTEAVSAVFRAFHTIKGSGAMSGFDYLSAFTHEIENVYDLVRNGKVRADRPLIDLTLRSCDLIREMIDCDDTEVSYFHSLADEILLSFRGLLPIIDGCAKSRIKLAPSGLSPFLTEDQEGPVIYRISFAPARGILARGADPLLLLKELRGLGTCSIVADTDAIPGLGDLDPEACYVRWDVILTTNAGINAVRDVFIFVEDECDVRIDVIGGGRAGETRDSVEAQAGVVPEGERRATATAGGHRRDVIHRIKVSSQKLDMLVNLVGELVTVQARLGQASAGRDDPELVSISEEVERLTEEIRDTTMNLRMLPVGALFNRFRRLVRDLSKELGKEVEMTVAGAGTELDKTVIEKLNDPMVHLIRNCIDHGIELPGVRESAGKSRKGTLRLSARQSGPDVLIQMRDDGVGLDPGLIREKAVEKGLILPDAEPTEKELFSLIFLPGFTTAANVSSVSGRGVGMDVVKKAVESLRGSIDVESEKGHGTTVTLRLPLTLAIIEGLLVRVADEILVFPLSMVEECVELTRRDIARAGGRHIANIRGQVVPYVRLREQFMFQGQRPDIEQVVIVRENGDMVGFVVDEVVGQHQTVVRTLGKILKDVEGISGATILGDGSVALILDIPRLLTIFEEEEVKRTA